MSRTKGWSIPQRNPYGGVSDEQAASGRFSLKITDGSAKGGSNSASQKIALPRPGYYELRGQVFPVEGRGLGMYARVLDRAGRCLSGESHVIGLGGNGRKWKPFAGRFIAYGEATHVQIWVHSYIRSKVTAYIDDIELVLVQEADASAEKDMETIKVRLREHVRGRPRGNLEGLVKSQRDGGSWPDIDYADQGRARWRPSGHMSRILSLAQGYVAGGTPWQKNEKVRDAVGRGLDFWFEKDFECPNWWYNRIGVPRQLYRIMLLVEDTLSDEQKQKGLRILRRSRLGMTGQNLVWVAEVTIARGCLAGQPMVVREAFDRIAKEIRISTGEGIQPDFSFYQHGTQLYSGGYGRGFAIDGAHFAALASGTSFALPDEKVEVLSKYLLDGEQWMIRGPRFDYSACGRELARRGAGSARGFAAAARNLASLDTPRRDEFLAFAERLTKGITAETPAIVGNRHFWRSDFMVHHRPGFYASVRMTSPRLIQTETCNNENLWGAHLSDGVNYLYRTGDEYHLIFPVWDWQRVPGITCELRPGSARTRGGRRGKRPFVGGVSDGHYGLCAMDFERGRLTARKSWFFFDRAYACLGSNITCPSEHPVITSINQCRLNGDVQVVDGNGARTLEPTEHRLERVQRVVHDDVAYIFPTDTDVAVKNEAQTGSWYHINRSYPQDEVTMGVFSLWLDHGSAPKDAAYRYIVAPGAGETEESAIRILQQDANAHAVWHEGDKVGGVAFWSPGGTTVPGLGTVRVDQACLVLLRQTAEGYRVAVSNPENEPLAVNVTVGARFEGEGVEAAGEAETRVRLDLPSGMYAGSSVVRELRRIAH